MAQLNEVTIEREVMRCPACNAEVKATLVFKITAEPSPMPEGEKHEFYMVNLGHKLKSVKLAHDCSRPETVQHREMDPFVAVPSQVGTTRAIKDNPQA